MRIYNTIEESQESAAVALGFFDGVHIAHQKIINEAVAFRKRCELTPTVFTFTVSTDTCNKKAGKHILTDQTKLEIFERHGVEQVYIPPLEMIMDMTPKQFFYEVLVEKLHAKAITCGYDYTFGKDASGSTDDLMELCTKNEIELVIINPQKAGGALVSSTKVKEALLNGNMGLVTKMLDSNYFLKAAVCHGNHLGRILGFPTINMQFESDQIIPKYGVYQTIVYIGPKIFRGLTNVGVKPTIDIGKEQAPVAETYILGFDEDIYGEIVVIAFQKMLRSEQKFDSLEELKTAIEKDVRSIGHEK